MAFSGEAEAVPEPGTGHQAETCMGSGSGGGGGGSAAGPETMEKSRPAAAETASHRHHEAVAPEQQAERMSTWKDGEGDQKLLPPAPKEEGDGQESAREKLKRHRLEMAGRVWVPEMWGQEKLLKDWMDCSAFDRPLVPASLLTARRALVAESCKRRPAQTPPASSRLQPSPGAKRLLLS